jgi:hypothetical protein
VFSCAPSYLVFCLCLLYIPDDLSTSHPVCLYLSCLWTYLLDTNRGFPPFYLSFCMPSRSVFSRFQSFDISPEPSCLLLVMPHLASSPMTASIPFYLPNPLPSRVVPPFFQWFRSSFLTSYLLNSVSLETHERDLLAGFSGLESWLFLHSGIPKTYVRTSLDSHNITYSDHAALSNRVASHQGHSRSYHVQVTIV